MRWVRCAETRALVAALVAAASARSTLARQTSAAGGFRFPADQIAGIYLKDTHWRGIECFYSYRISDGSRHAEFGQAFVDRILTGWSKTSVRTQNGSSPSRSCEPVNSTSSRSWPRTMTVEMVEVYVKYSR